jgi:hypothetical protein
MHHFTVDVIYNQNNLIQAFNGEIRGSRLRVITEDFDSEGI